MILLKFHPAWQTGRYCAILALACLCALGFTSGCKAGKSSDAAATANTNSATPGENASPSFKDNGDGTVTDLKTGLIWQKNDDGQKRSWTDSTSYCAGLSLGNHSDWRLPAKELVSLWKDAGAKPEVRKVYFPSMKSDFYWTSKPGATLPGDMRLFWGITFSGHGAERMGDDSDLGYARCVRLASSSR